MATSSSSVTTIARAMSDNGVMSAAHLFLVCGLPGAGKTATATQLAVEHQAVRMCPDEWMEHLGVDLWDAEARERIEQLQWATAGEILRRGTNIVIEWGLWRRWERQRLITEAHSIGVAVHLVLLDPPLDVLWERIESRGRETRLGARAITRAELKQWHHDFERPDDDELARYDALTVDEIRDDRGM